MKKFNFNHQNNIVDSPDTRNVIDKDLDHQDSNNTTNLDSKLQNDHGHLECEKILPFINVGNDCDDANVSQVESPNKFFNNGTRNVNLSPKRQLYSSQSRKFNLPNNFQLQRNNTLNTATSIIEEEHWVPGFMDLIYVGVIINIEIFFKNCGSSYFSVFALSAGYFFIMFNTRMLFDIYSICFLANDIVHRLLLLFYCLAVYIMALNIGSQQLDIENEATSSYNFGHCSQQQKYTIGFAAAFIVTRTIMIILYSLLIAYPESEEDEELSREEIEAHTRDYKLKLVPLILSCLVMAFSFGDYPKVIIFPLTAFVEMSWDLFIESFLPCSKIPEAKVYQERLGTFFMVDYIYCF